MNYLIFLLKLHQYEVRGKAYGWFLWETRQVGHYRHGYRTRWSNCGKDYIQIQNGFLYGSGVPPGRLCGTLTRNSTFASFRETLIVRFVTDGSVTGRGFKATYAQVIPSRK